MVNGNFGLLASVSGDREWIEDAVDASEDQPGYRRIEVPGFDAYTYSWPVSRNWNVTSVSLVDPDREFYMDFVATGVGESDIPTDADGTAFTTAVPDALEVDSPSTREIWIRSGGADRGRVRR